MGSVANFSLGLFGVGPDGTKKRVQNAQAKALGQYNTATDALTPPVIPELPKAPNGPSEASKAAAALRKKARANQGYTSTLLTGPGGAPSVPTVKKGLLGV